jgi:hypothetical protein
MTNGETRKQLEMKNLFKSPKYAREAFRAIGNVIAQRPARAPVAQYDKDGNLTYTSAIETYTYKQLYNDLEILKDPNRTEPTELEMMIACQMVLARTNPSSFVAIRDTLGAKPVDEAKVEANVNQYEELTDDELEALAAYRDAKKQAIVESEDVETTDAAE